MSQHKISQNELAKLNKIQLQNNLAGYLYWLLLEHGGKERGVVFAANHTLDHNYGSGAGQLAQSIGGEIGSADYNRAVSSFKSKFNNLTGAGASPEQAKEAISGMVSTVNSRFQNEGGNVKSILSEESKKINAGFANNDKEVTINNNNK